MTEINLGLQFEQIFGYPAPAFQPKVDAVVGDKLTNRDNEGSAGSTPYYAVDTNGREVFMPLYLNYTGTDGVLKSLTLLYAVVGIKGSKHIVDTELTEREGMVSELINIGSYKVHVDGFFIDNGNGNDYPEAQVTVLRDLYEQNVPITLKCAKTDIFLLRPTTGGSSTVTIREFDMPANRGVKHVQPYSMELWSDVNFNLTEV